MAFFKGYFYGFSLTIFNADIDNNTNIKYYV